MSKRKWNKLETWLLNGQTTAQRFVSLASDSFDCILHRNESLMFARNPKISLTIQFKSPAQANMPNDCPNGHVSGVTLIWVR